MGAPINSQDQRVWAQLARTVRAAELGAPRYGVLVLVLLAAVVFGSGNRANADDAPSMQVNIDLFPATEERSSTFLNFELYEVPLSVPNDDAGEFRSELTTTIQGKVWRRDFMLPDSKATPVEVFSNYREALVTRGFEVLFECQRDACGSGGSSWYKPLRNSLATNIPPDQQFYLAARLREPDTYVVLFVKGQPGNSVVEYMLDMVEPNVMETGRVAISMDEMVAALERSGKVAIYDIFFETGKDTITAESDPVLGDIAKLLARKSDLSLYVVGHTDDTGSLELNKGLSQQRASAVVNDLVERGVDSQRLTPFGAGPFAPAATNRSESGRTSNRRVELVERLSLDAN